MTPKQQVKARHPGAYCLWDGCWWVYLDGMTIGMGDAPQQAWADALRRMKACTHPPTRL